MNLDNCSSELFSPWDPLRIIFLICMVLFHKDDVVGVFCGLNPSLLTTFIVCFYRIVFNSLLYICNTCLSRSPFGYLLDRYGPKTTCIVACSVFLLGCFLCIAGTSLGFDGYLLGFCLFGLSGPGVQVCGGLFLPLDVLIKC